MKKLNEDPNIVMMKGALIPSLIVGFLGIVVATSIKGSAGLFGALLAQVVVIIFFLVSVGVAYLTKDAEPVLTMALALFSYFSKILLLGAAMFFIGKLANDDQISRTSFGLNAIVLTFAWLTGEVRTFLKLKLHLPLPKK